MPNHYDDGEYKGSEHATDVFKAPPKEQTEGEKLEESGEYLQDPETVDTSQPLESKSFEIDPNKNTPTKREKEREDRLRKRAGSGQQGADIAKKKLPKSKQTDLPQFLQSTQMDESYARENIGDPLGPYQDPNTGSMRGVPDEERIRILSEVGKKILNTGSPQQQLQYVATVLKYGSKAARLIFAIVTAGTGTGAYR